MPEPSGLIPTTHERFFSFSLLSVTARSEKVMVYQDILIIQLQKTIQQSGIEVMNDSKIDCWEFKKCGREPGGKNIEKYGLCSLVVSLEDNKINNKRNGERLCWSLRESACEGIMRECCVNEIKECRQCTFYIFLQESYNQGSGCAKR
ncbi:MAG: hypothetical protein D3916_05850 [Candidatus Electrothrix sp. MAN1_4]|nr:hypothetical protein [Candidatus Electrothrix sp. MAN1_4]